MDLIVNGSSVATTAETVADLLSELGAIDKMVVVEADGRILTKEEWAGTALSAGMTLEIVHFVGGG